MAASRNNAVQSAAEKPSRSAASAFRSTSAPSGTERAAVLRMSVRA
ncbi:Uncharacterised protein [Mycobacteroides abscessus subsp. abscessus]|nr:Uncharacterised protein [Mycobacteroides abscessus subsp. abscessus]